MKQNYIDGQWVQSARSRLNQNPSDLSDTVGEYAQADADEAKRAIDAASLAQQEWATGDVQFRANCLDYIGTEILARKQELGTLLSREEGKTLAEGVGEFDRAGRIFKFFAGEALRLRGDKLASVRKGVEVEVTREPVGVVGLITPWNFPAAIPAWKIAPALAYGNSIVFKPADLVPGSAWALADIVSGSGLPPGVFNLVMGRGSVVGQALVQSDKVNAISFTGSVGTGRRLVADASARLAKVQVEMGGKNPLVVLDDADLDTAVMCAVQGSYYSTGQRCTASSRIIVEKGIYARFVRALGVAVHELRVGHALDPQTQLGPVVDSGQLESNLRYVGIGRDEGATLAFGGERIKGAADGFYMSPALFIDASAEMRIAREEIFGPVACVIAADSYEHALALANDSEFGLSAGICTTSLRKATHFKRHMRSGMVMVNVPTAGVDYHVPFGGTKGSSYGAREQGSYATDFYTTVKTAYVFA
jgi:acyl-CoA reductase-like NAD-dependent aldehyde dehydrogenase